MSKSGGTSVETVLKAVVSLGELVAELPTRNDVEKIVEEAVKDIRQEVGDISREVKAISRAVDKDAEAVINHGKRITHVEKHLAI